jgi:hypothetical protein
MTIMKKLVAGSLTLVLGTGLAFGDTPNLSNGQGKNSQPGHNVSGQSHGQTQGQGQGKMHGNTQGTSGNIHGSGSMNNADGNLVTGQMVACTNYSPAQIKQIKTFLHDSKITLAQAIELGQNDIQNGQFIECELITNGAGPSFEYEAFVNDTFTCATICGTEGKVASTYTPTPTTKQQSCLTAWKGVNKNAKITPNEALTTVSKQFNNAMPFSICLVQNNNMPVWKIECFRSDNVWTAWVDAVDGKVITPTVTGTGSY